ncbi:MAG: hypothetical protein CSB44_11005 [Gammaproteobacteria bacterium]|nr:MAG: hypothetical protein CSB44_11005 [Gammaproteobacteria bacterium]
MSQKSTARAAVVDALRVRFGDRLSTGQSQREQHGHGESWHAPALPDAVVMVESTEEVAEVVSLCARHRVPVIPFGAGTSLEGHLQAIEGGISIDLSSMRAVLAVNADDFDCRVQAGISHRELNDYLHDTGLFFPVDPGAGASIGGMTATRASGTNAVRYGTMRENVMSLTYVDAHGNIVNTGSRAKKSSAGYDLTHLLVGSEGTLGVITEVGLRLHGLPEAIRSAVVDFPSVDEAVRTVIETIQMGLPMARIELVDHQYMAAINDYSKLDYPVRDTLFLEFHGTEQSVEEQVALFGDIAAEHGAGEMLSAKFEEDRQRLWRARHDAYFAITARYPGKLAMTTDACVPISKLGEIVSYVREAMQDSRFEPAVIGHVGDGNFHMIFCIDPENADELAEAQRCNAMLVEKTLELGGTCTGEHGVGLGKLKYLRREHGDAAVDTMRVIKRALDPHDIMNPGKTVAI